MAGLDSPLTGVSPTHHAGGGLCALDQQFDPLLAHLFRKARSGPADRQSPRQVGLGIEDGCREAAEAQLTLTNTYGMIVSPPADYTTPTGAKVSADDVDLVARLSFMLKMHKTYPITGTVCTGAAVRIPGTVAHEVTRPEAQERLAVSIGHPGGVLPVEAGYEVTDGSVTITKLGVYRTARRIMDGQVYVRKSVYS